MNKLLIGVLALALLVGGTITAFSQSGRATPGQIGPEIAPTLAVAPTRAVLPGGITDGANTGVSPALLQENPAVVEARVVPPISYQLHFETSGTVADVLVKEGDTVAKGAVIARLDARALDLEIREAEALLAEYKADYERLLAGATPAEIEQARARVERAKAQLKLTETTVSPADIAAAEARVEALKVKLAELEKLPEAPELEVARAKLEEAQLNLQSDRDTLAAEKTVLEFQLEQAANNLRDLQDAYRRIKERNAASGELTQDDIDAENKARRAMENADKIYQQAQVLLEEARKIEISALRASEARVRVAQATLDRVLASKEPEEIAETRAQLAEAQAALAKLQDDYRASYLGVSQAEVAVAEADLARVRADTRAVDIAAADARVKRAEVQLMQKKFALERMVLRAPTAGTIASLDIAEGAVVTSEQVAGILADVTKWEIATVDLSELNVVGLEVGDPVVITFYAIPGLELPGKISRIETIGESFRGADTTYSLIITPDQQDDRLRWNMTAAVRILPKR